MYQGFFGIWRFMCLSFLILPRESTMFRHVYPCILTCPALCSCYQISGRSLQTQAESGSQWPVMSSYPWHRPIIAPWHRVRHGRTGWSWEDSLTPACTTAGFVQKKHGSAMRNLSLWIGSCVHYIRDWFSVGIPSTKPLTVWKTPGCVVAPEHSRTDWEGNTARFVQHRAAVQNISLWFRVTKGKYFLLSSSALSVIGLLSLSWLTTECIIMHIQWLEKN